MAELGMRPSDLPDRSCVTARKGAERVGRAFAHTDWDHSPFESMPTRPLRLAVHHVEDLHCPVGRTCREAFPVVIQLRIVLDLC